MPEPSGFDKSHQHSCAARPALLHPHWQPPVWGGLTFIMSITSSHPLIVPAGPDIYSTFLPKQASIEVSTIRTPASLYSNCPGCWISEDAGHMPGPATVGPGLNKQYHVSISYIYSMIKNYCNCTDNSQPYSHNSLLQRRRDSGVCTVTFQPISEVS